MSKSRVFAETFGSLTYYPRKQLTEDSHAEVDVYFNVENWLTMDEVYDLRDALDNVIRHHEALEKEAND